MYLFSPDLHISTRFPPVFASGFAENRHVIYGRNAYILTLGRESFGLFGDVRFRTIFCGECGEIAQQKDFKVGTASAVWYVLVFYSTRRVEACELKNSPNAKKCVVPPWTPGQ